MEGTNDSYTTVRSTARSGASSRSFTLDQAILTALGRNPDILRAKQEIERTRGIILEIGAQALPHLSPRGDLTWTDPNLAGSGGGGGGGITGGTVSGGTDTAYAIRITGTQLVFNYGTFR